MTSHEGARLPIQSAHPVPELAHQPGTPPAYPRHEECGEELMPSLSRSLF